MRKRIKIPFLSQAMEKERGLFFMQDKERNAIERLAGIEDLVEKKTKIYSRLLMDVALAKEMEGLSLRHQSRKTELERLLYGKAKNEKGGRKE